MVSSAHETAVGRIRQENDWAYEFAKAQAVKISRSDTTRLDRVDQVYTRLIYRQEGKLAVDRVPDCDLVTGPQ